MNCKESQKFLYAFADGELETPENLDVLEHLNMCPVCTQKVNAQQQLKQAIKRVMGDEAAPDALRTSVKAVIDREVASPASDDPIMAATGSSVRAGRRRYWIPATAAAAIALAAVGVWQWGNPASPPNIETDPVVEATPVTFTDDSEAAVTLANHVLEGHLHCCRMGPKHHDPTLPRDGVEAARLLADRLDGRPMLRCEQLARAREGGFVSAAVCKLVSADGRELEVGHLIFKLDEDRMVSVISVPVLSEMADLKKVAIGRREYAILKPETDADHGPATVVVFNCPKATHIVCAPLAPPDAIELVEPMQLMAKQPSPAPPIRLASLSH